VLFEWDPNKSDVNQARRGFNFAFAALVFAGPTLERHDRRGAYGETRVIAIGRVNELCLTVVYTDRLIDGSTVRRIISARPSSRRERQSYDETNFDRTGP
jgi:uncharacterized DUF497 family protein